MLEHFRTLTVEATQLGSNNMTLESEARSTRNSLRNAESKIANLESEIESKDRLVSSYLEQVTRFCWSTCNYIFLMEKICYLISVYLSGVG